MVASPNLPGTMGTAAVSSPSLSWLKTSTGLTTMAGVVTFPAVVANAAEVGAVVVLGSIKARGELEVSVSMMSVTFVSGVGLVSAVVELGVGRFVTSDGGVGIFPVVGGPIRLGAMASASLDAEMDNKGATPIN